MENSILKIGICDDEQIILNQLERILIDCIQKLSIKAEIISFHSGKELLHKISELDVVFLDINMPEMDGIETGRYIQKIKKDIKIIMATSMVERFKESFKINAFRFITKPFELDEIKEALNTILNLNIGSEVIELYEKRQLYSIQHRDIQYIVSNDSYVEFIVGDRVFRKETSINELEKIMNPMLFFRIHRKYMINMLWIQKTYEKRIKINNTEIPISRRNRKDFEQVYIRFDLRMGRN